MMSAAPTHCPTRCRIIDQIMLHPLARLSLPIGTVA
jgi:hypothetical protein